MKRVIKKSDIVKTIEATLARVNESFDTLKGDSNPQVRRIVNEQKGKIYALEAVLDMLKYGDDFLMKIL